jgi:hypothetical protein
MNRRLLTAFAPGFAPGLALCALMLVSCGGNASPAELTNDGYAALGKSDWKGAAGDFDRALAGLKTTDADYLRAKLGLIEALVHTDAPKAKSEFLALAAGTPSPVTSKNFVVVASKLAGERKFSDAIDVIEVGKQMYPEDTKLNEVGKALAKAASKAGDSEAEKRLKGLGYLGD